MDPFICTACGTQYTPSSVAPRQCAICEEERQYVPPRGQTWTTLGALAAGHFNSYRQYEPGVIGIGTQPSFAIGQRALLVCTPSGNVLWDCIAMLDPATITLINGLGGLKAIGISHRTSIPQWWNGAARSAAFRSTFMPMTTAGLCGLIHRSNYGMERPWSFCLM